MYFIAEVYKVGRDAPLSAFLSLAINNFQQLKISAYQKYPSGVGSYINTIYITDQSDWYAGLKDQKQVESQHGHFKNGKWISEIGNIPLKTHVIAHQLHGRSAEPNYMIVHPDLWHRIMVYSRDVYYDCENMLRRRGIAVDVSSSLVAPDEFMLACKTPKEYGYIKDDKLKVVENPYAYYKNNNW